MSGCVVSENRKASWLHYIQTVEDFNPILDRLYKMISAKKNRPVENVQEYHPKRVGERLLGVRRAHGLSQSKFADLCDVSVAALSHWEQGRQRPSIAAANRICDVFSLTLDYLLRGKADTLAHSVFLQLRHSSRS